MDRLPPFTHVLFRLLFYSIHGQVGTAHRPPPLPPLPHGQVGGQVSLGPIP
jgi:hypothetical protein